MFSQLCVSMPALPGHSVSRRTWRGWQNSSHAEALEREEPFSQNYFHPLLVRGLVACLLEAPSTPMEEILFILPLAEVPQLREFEQLFKSLCELTKKKNPSEGPAAEKGILTSAKRTMLSKQN